MFVEVVRDVLALVERDLAVGVDEERDLVFSTERRELGVRACVPDVATRSAGIVSDVGDAEFGERLADFLQNGQPSA